MTTKLLKLTTTIAAGVIMATLAGCSTLSSGTITGKVIEPERRYTTTAIVGKVPVTTWHTDDEDYCFAISEADETGYICVDRTTFDSYNEGDYYSAESN